MEHTNHCIEVFWRTRQPNGREADLSAEIAELGIDRVGSVRISDLTFIRGRLSTAETEHLARALLVDPVVEGHRSWSGRTMRAVNVERSAAHGDELVVEVGYHPGVTDPVADHLLCRTQMLEMGSIDAVATGTRYTFTGNLSTSDLHRIAEEVVCNNVIQTYALPFAADLSAPE